MIKSEIIIKQKGKISGDIMINFAVIGGFWLTDEFIKAIKESEGVRYYAQYSRKIEKAEEYGKARGAVKYYSDLRELANDKDIDAVYIASPNRYHYEQSKLMIDAGKHVLCEKPITPTTDEFKELSELADKKGVIYSEAMMNIHHPCIKELKNLIDSSGEIVHVRFDFDQRSSKLEKWKSGESFSTFSKSSFGGAIMDLGVYVTSLATYLFGMPADVFALGHFNKDGADMKDTFVLIYDDFEVVCTISKLAESSIRSEILCDKNVITFDNISRLENIVSHGENEMIISNNNSFVECMKHEISDLKTYIEGGREEYIINRGYTEMSVNLLEKLRKKTGYII